MVDFCSAYCVKFEQCSDLGIVDFMNVLPKHPDKLKNKKWCESFEEAEDSKER